jgi:hypothetical protein
MIGQGLGRVAQAEKLSIQQLEEALENRTIPAYIGIPLLEEKVQIEQRMKMAQAGQMPPPEMTIADQVMGQAENSPAGSTRHQSTLPRRWPVVGLWRLKTVARSSVSRTKAWFKSKSRR